ncbi:creatininase family protein [Psychrobacillus sp. L4]|uniref:creatininase family protein n=1 Tax=Psychrobacillus sp. L4 TaxID=3236892 RepID=UPI0036F3C4A4
MYLMDLNASKFNEVKQTVNTILLPIGMMETHGPHATLGTDVWIPREFVKRLDKIIGEKVIMAPEVAYGHSWALAPHSGTFDISSEAFSNYVYEIGKEFYRNGFTNLILFNGHGGNIPSLAIVTEKLADMGVNTLTINWWMDYREDILTITSKPGHGGEDETSLVLAIDENLADLSLAGDFSIEYNRKLKYKDMGKVLYKDGYMGDAASATPEKGEVLYQLLTNLILEDIKDLWELSASELLSKGES